MERQVSVTQIVLSVVSVCVRACVCACTRAGLRCNTTLLGDEDRAKAERYLAGGGGR
jgi:hypothetical protein